MSLLCELSISLNWDSELSKLVFRFLVNMIMILTLVRGVYFSYKQDNEFAFTFIVFNIIIFFICYLMLSINISLGVAFGLFAIFGILRYRTDTIPIKEMTYLFTAIAIAMINALGPFETIFFINIVLVISVFLMEKLWYSKKELSKNIQYEKVNLLQNEDHSEAINDIKKRTGLDVTRIEVKSFNFLNDSASLKVFYKQQ